MLPKNYQVSSKIFRSSRFSPKKFRRYSEDDSSTGARVPRRLGAVESPPKINNPNLRPTERARPEFSIIDGPSRATGYPGPSGPPAPTNADRNPRYRGPGLHFGHHCPKKNVTVSILLNFVNKRDNPWKRYPQPFPRGKTC